MARKLAISIPKGGVGKTTTAVNLAAVLAILYKLRVLVVDLDPQASATAFLGVDPYAVERNITHVLADVKVNTRDVILETASGVHLLPSHRDLADFIPGMRGPRYGQVRDILAPVENDYDFIIIDSPPQESGLIWNILAYVTEVIIPLEAHYLAVRGLADALQMIDDARSINGDLRVKGILMTKVNPLTVIHREYIDQVKQHSPRLVYPFMVGLHVAHQEAASNGQPILLYAPSHPGSDAYKELARTLVDGKKAA